MSGERLFRLTQLKTVRRASLADADNMLAVIYAEQGDAASASAQWRGLLQTWPGYLPARTNLAFLNAAHTLDTPPHERQPVEVAPAREARALHLSTADIRH